MQAGWPPPRHSGPWMPIYSPLRSSGSFLLIDAGRGLREIPHVRPKPTPAARHTRTRARTLAWELSCPGPGCARRSAGGRHAGIWPQGPARARTRSRPGPGVRETLAGSLLFLGSWRVWAGASRRLGQDRGTGGVQAAEDACKAFPKLPICRPVRKQKARSPQACLSHDARKFQVTTAAVLRGTESGHTHTHRALGQVARPLHAPVPTEASPEQRTGHRGTLDAWGHLLGRRRTRSDPVRSPVPSAGTLSTEPPWSGPDCLLRRPWCRISQPAPVPLIQGPTERPERGSRRQEQGDRPLGGGQRGGLLLCPLARLGLRHRSEPATS